MKTYPQIYDYKPLADIISNSVTTALLDAITKLARPHYSEGQFSTAYDWRIRLEVLCSDCKRPNVLSYVLDVGQGYESCSLKKFKANCNISKSVIEVAYCDNNLVFSQNSIAQWSGTFKVYAMTNGNIHECARQRWITELASAYVEAINSLDEHFMVVDTAAIRL